MKRFFILLLVAVCPFFVAAQFYLPYSYNFDQSMSLTDGWTLDVDDPSSFDVLMGGVQQANADAHSAPAVWAFCSMFGTDSHQYLISPRFIGNGTDSVKLIFYYKAGEAGTVETLRVGYHTDGSFQSVSDFQWTAPSVQTSSVLWQEYSVVLPPATQFIALDYTSFGRFFLSIDDIELTMVEGKATYPITVTYNAGGTVVPGSTIATEGDTITFNMLPDMGHYVENVWVDSVRVGNVSSYTFNNVTAAHTLQARFRLNDYEIHITTSGDGSGSVTPSGLVYGLLLAPWDTTITFTFTPAPGSYLFDVIVDDTLHLGVVPDFTLEHIRENHTIEAVYTLESYVVRTSTNGHGTITPGGVTSYHYDDEQTFNIHADTGYWIDTLYVDGVVCDSATHQTDFAYHLDSIEDNHTISVVFSKISYLITTITSDGGIIQIDGAEYVASDTYLAYYGDVLTVYTQPATGYYVAGLTVNGEPQTVLTSYVINGITDQYLISAQFSMYQYSIIANYNDLGMVFPDEMQQVDYFDTAFFDIILPDCILVDSVLFDGERLSVQDSYAFTELIGEHTLDVFFNDIYYNYQLLTDEHGFILGEEDVLCGSDEVYLIVPDYCYQFSAFYIDNEEASSQLQNLDGNIGFVADNISDDHVLYAEFQQVEYVMNITTPTGHGTWIANDTLLCDSTLYVMVAPDACFVPSAVSIDGEFYNLTNGELPIDAYFDEDTLYFSIAAVDHAYDIELSFDRKILTEIVVPADNGTITSLTDTIYCGGAVAWLLSPADCYHVAAVYVNEVDYTSQLQAVGQNMQLTIASQNETPVVRAEFTIDNMQVSYQTAANGSIITSSDSAVACGDDVTFTFIPDDCYQLDAVMVNGLPVEDDFIHIPSTTSTHTGDTVVYVLRNIVHDCLVTANFVPLTYTVETTVTGEGTIAYLPADSAIVCGDAITYTITPDACFMVSEVYCNGVPVTNYTLTGGVATFTVPAVYETQRVEAIFDRMSYAITSNATAHGIIVHPTDVVCGDSLWVEFVPDNCYFVDSIWIDGVLLPAASWHAEASNAVSYVVRNVTSAHHFAAHFSRIEYAVHIASNLPFTVSPADTVIACGTDCQFQLVADACHQLDSVVVNGMNYPFSTLLINGYLNRLGNVYYFTFPQIGEPTNFDVYIHEITYPLAVNYNAGGVVVYPSMTEITCGTDVGFQIIPDDCREISDVMLNGNSVFSQLVWNGNQAAFDVRDCHRAVTLDVIFTQPDYHVDVVWLADGDSLDTRNYLAHCGDSLSIATSWADDCFAYDTAYLNGAGITVDSLLVLQDIRADVRLEIVLHKIIYRITVAELSGGAQLVPFGRNDVECGHDLVVDFIPADNYDLVGWIVDGDTIPATPSYIFEDVHANHTLSAVLEGTGYHIQATAGAGGMVSPSDAYVNAGDTADFTIIPDPCFVIDSVWADGVFVGNVNAYSFNDVNEDHILEATFRQLSYNMVLSAGQHGYISLSGSPMVACGDRRVVTIAPDDCYQVQSLMINGVESSAQLASLTALSTLVLDDISSNYRISVSFAPIQYAVTVNSNAGGTAAAALPVVDCGSNTEVAIQPDDCHLIDSVFVNGTYYGSDTLLALADVREDMQVDVVFVLKQYPLVALQSLGGSILPSDTVMVGCGDSLTYHFVADAGHHLDEVWLDNVAVGADTAYTVSNVRAPHTISAVFTRNAYSVSVETQGNGVVLPTTDTLLYYGDSIRLDFVADACSKVDSVWVDGEYVGDDTTLTLRNIAQNESVRVAFIEKTFVVTAEAPSNGSVLPAGETAVTCGDTLLYTTSPAPGYHQSAWIVDGDTLPATTSFALNDIRENHTISAVFDRNIYTISVQTTGIGSASVPASVSVAYGDDLSIVFSAGDCYHVDSLIVDGIFVSADTSLLLQNITDNHQVMAVFAPDYYNVTMVVMMNQTEISRETVSVMCGADTLLQFPEVACYHVANVVVNGNIVAAATTYTLTDVRADYIVEVTLTPETYMVIAQVEGQGAVVPADTSWVECGGNVDFVFVADEGWYLSDILVDGESVEVVEDYFTLTGVSANHIITAVFVRTEYVIISSIDPISAGNITPYGATYVTAGDDITFRISPFPAYQISDVVVDGVSVGAVASYTFENVQDNHTIDAYLNNVGMDEQTAEVLRVYAADQSLYVDNSTGKAVDLLSVFDMSGRCVYEVTNLCGAQVLSFNVAPGIYLVRLRAAGAVLTYKVRF